MTALAFYIRPVIGFLRLVGVFNAAIWFGGVVFLTLFGAPAFFSPEMLNIFGGESHPYARAWAGKAVQVLFDRYLLMQQICAGIAMAHLLAEWLYTGRRPRRMIGWLLGGLLAVALLGGWWLQPKLSMLHVTRYGVRSSPEQRAEAARSFKFWHGVSQVVNLFVLAGVGIYFWSAVNPPEDLRFVGAKQPYRS